MKKMPTLFVRDMQNHLITPDIMPSCEWVIAGEGVATVKWDGTACLVRGGKLYRRFDAKQGKTPPPNFEPLQDPDPITGHWPGWIPIGDGANDRYHREAWENQPRDVLEWTYELIGPKVQGNPYDLEEHTLREHGIPFESQPPLSFDGLRSFLSACRVEGIVWWRDINDVDCDKCKVKRRDFNLPWPSSKGMP